MPNRFGRIIETAGPDVALFKSGPRGRAEVVVGGRMSHIPALHRVDSLSVAMRTVSVSTRGALSLNGVRLNVDATINVKLMGWSPSSASPAPHASTSSVRGGGDGGRLGGGGDDLRQDNAALWLAAQHFLNKSEAEIAEVIRGTVAGHQRAIVASLTVEQLRGDRAAFADRVVSLCAPDLRAMGLAVVWYGVTALSDDHGYLAALGVTETSRVQRDAAVGEAVNRARARAREAEHDAAAYIAEARQRAAKGVSDRRRLVAQMDAEAALARQRVVTEKATQIAAAEQDKVLLVKRQQARAAEAAAELAVLRREVQRQRLAQQKEVHVEADAQLYKATVDASTTLQEARAEAHRIRLMGAADAAVIRAEGKADNELLRERNLAWLRADNYDALGEQMRQVAGEVAEVLTAPMHKADRVFVDI